MKLWHHFEKYKFENWAPPQRDRLELLDAGNASFHDVRESLRDLRRINAWLGNSQLVAKEIIALLERHNLESATILDVGTGSADLPVYLLRAAKHDNVDLKIIALDCKPLHLHLADAELQREPLQDRQRVLLLGADAFRLPFQDQSLDLVTSSLFLHHFRPAQIELLLREFLRVARHGFVMNDLVRHYVPLVFFKATWPIFARSHLTRHDGAASFHRGYTVAEMRAHLGRMDLGSIKVDVKLHFFRISVIGEMP